MPNDNEENQTKPCGWCEGDGYLIGQHDGMPVQRLGDCPGCDGSGEEPGR